MNNKKNNSILNTYNTTNIEMSDLSRMSDQIKANIAVTLLKHRLKSYIAESS